MKDVNNINNDQIVEDQHIFYHDRFTRRHNGNTVVGFAKGVWGSMTGALSRLFMSSARETSNSRKLGNYTKEAVNVMKFPLIVTENIDYPVVAKFCAYLQKEKAENIRIFFYNNDLYLAQAPSMLAKEFDSKFYESNMGSYDGLTQLSEVGFKKLKRLEGIKSDHRRDEIAYKSGLDFNNAKDLAQMNHIYSLKQIGANTDSQIKVANIRYHHTQSLNKQSHQYAKELQDRDHNFRAGEADRSREFTAAQNDLDREFREKLQKGDQEFRKGERLDSEKFQSGESEKQRKHSSEESEKSRKHHEKMADINHELALKKAEFEHELRNRVSKADELSLNSQHNQSVFNQGLHLRGRDLMPINPTMINVIANHGATGKQIYQILGIRYLPHLIPFSEVKTAFKYKILNNRGIYRFVKLVCGDITFKDFFTKSDANALNKFFTKISVNEKSWSNNLEKARQPVTFIMTKEEFEDICDNVCDLRKPNIIKNVQKDVGLLDIFVLDKAGKSVIRLCEHDGFVPVKHDISEILNSNERDLVINARIDSSKLRSEV